MCGKITRKIGETPVETKRAGKEKVVEDKQLPMRAKTCDMKALKEKDNKGDD